MKVYRYSGSRVCSGPAEGAAHARILLVLVSVVVLTFSVLWRVMLLLSDVCGSSCTSCFFAVQGAEESEAGINFR